MSFRLCVLAAALIAATFGLFRAGIAAPGEATFLAAEGALIATHFDDARRLYAATASSSSQPPKDRASSLRQLGVLAWRLQNDAAAADRFFGDALRVGADLSLTHMERARFLSHVGRHADAIAAADAAVTTAVSASDRQAAALGLANAVLAKLKDVNIAAQTNEDRAQLAHTRDVFRPFYEAPPMTVKHAAALLGIALRLEDGPLALTAWHSYAREGAEAGTWAPAARILDAALPRIRPGAMTSELRNEIFEGLRGSHYFDLAMIVANDDRLGDKATFLSAPRVVEAAAYAKFLDDITTATDEYYRSIAIGRTNNKAWHNALNASVARLWQRLQIAGTPQALESQPVKGELARRFGTYINMGMTGAVEDLHAGHIFLDDARKIEQYGHVASIRRTAIDRLISNGYETWVWDGRQGHGGWASTDRVYQVRPGYADIGLRIWDRITDPTQRPEIEQKIAMMSAGDDAIAAKEAGVFLPGLAVRLDWAGENAIIERLKAQGKANLKESFLMERLRLELQSNFFAHEGRHVLDKIAFGKDLQDEELEYRAKLSEIAFSDEPRINFGSIFNPNIADASSPHGRANKRIAVGLVAWMQAHKADIAGLDPARPLLPQFDKLTPDQMRAAMRSMDPWAK